MAKEKKGLGIGLDALFGPADEAEESELQTISLNKIEPRQEQPREYFDEAALQTLADSISEHGLLQPIIVRKLSTGYYQIIAGERRWRASRIAGLKEVPVRVIEADDRRTAELALVENLQREDLNPLEEARGYKSLMEDYGLTQEETSRSVGRSRPAVANAIRLLSLSQPVQQYVETGKLSAGHARALLSIESPEQQKKAADQILEKNLTVRGAEQLSSRLAKQLKMEELTTTKEIAVNYAAEEAARLSQILSRKIRIQDGKKTGKIEIEYYGADDREKLIQALSALHLEESEHA